MAVMKRCTVCRNWFNLRSIDCPACGAWATKDIAKAMKTDFRHHAQTPVKLTQELSCGVRIAIHPGRGSDVAQHHQYFICPDHKSLETVPASIIRGARLAGFPSKYPAHE